MTWNRERPWHAKRESVFIIMRQLDDIIYHELEQARNLAPRNGQLAIGGADFDHVLKGSILAEFVYALNQGMSKQEAYELATSRGKDFVANWNDKVSKTRVHINSPHELKRSPDSAESIALACLVRFSGIGDPEGR